MDTLTLTIVVAVYFFALAFLGWKGYKNTKTASDYLIAGRGIHPFVMALSYGATFISTSAIIGFGGVAANFGHGLIWLTFLNIFVGIFIAFVFLGKRTRAMGHQLNAHTFPELLGRRYQSKFIQVFSGVVIMTMVIYAAVVMIGGAEYFKETFKVDFNIALFILAIITIAYVITGGLKGVMYTDALQGVLMFAGMIFILIFAYTNVGGPGESHKKLGEVFDTLKNKNIHELVITIAKDNSMELNQEQAVFLVNEFGKIMKETKPITDAEKKKEKVKEMLGLIKNETITDLSKVGEVFKKSAPHIAQKGYIEDISKKGHQGWNKMPAGGSPFWWLLVSSIIMGVGIGVLAQPQLAVRFMTVKSDKELNRAVLVGGIFILMMTGVAFEVGGLTNIWFHDQPATKGLTSLIVAGGNVDAVMPTFFDKALPKWFNYLLMLSLISAAMSTMSSQFHTMGTAISRDIFEATNIIKEKSGKKSILVTKLGIVVMFLVTVLLSYVLPKGFIAAGTSLFFGFCAAAFLPAYVGGLFWKGATKKGAIASIVTGFFASIFWLFFVHTFTVARWGAASILKGTALESFSFVDPLFIAFPLSLIVFIVVSLASKKPEQVHLELCFKNNRQK